MLVDYEDVFVATNCFLVLIEGYSGRKDRGHSFLTTS